MPAAMTVIPMRMIKQLRMNSAIESLHVSIVTLHAF
jgi:hypothetical protein